MKYEDIKWDKLQLISTMLRYDTDVRTQWDFTVYMRGIKYEEAREQNIDYYTSCATYGCAIGWAEQKGILPPSVHWHRVSQELNMPHGLYGAIFVARTGYHQLTGKTVTPDMVADHIDFWLSDIGKFAYDEVMYKYKDAPHALDFTVAYHKYKEQ